MTATYRMVLVLALLMLSICASAAEAAFPGRSGAIVYGKWSERVPSEDYGGGHFFSLESQTLSGQTSTVWDCGSCRAFLDPAISPDGSMVAFGVNGVLSLVPFEGGERQELPVGLAHADHPAFAPTGTRLVFSADGGIWTSDLNGGEVREVVPNGAAPVWSSRNWIAFVRKATIYRVRPDGRGLRRLVRNAVLPGWSPDGAHLVFSRPLRRPNGILRQGILVVDGDGRHVRSVSRTPMRDVLDVAWSPDGRRLLVSRDLHGLVAVDLRGQVQQTFDLDGGDIDTSMGVDWQALPRLRRPRP